jgi:hypothetical protein
MIWEDSVYLVMHIGCLECHNPSRVAYIEDDLVDAKEAVERERAVHWEVDPHSEWAWGGDGVYAIYKLPAGDLVAVGR